MQTDAEGAVLGACIIDPSAYWRVADFLHEQDFLSLENRKLWTLIADLSNENIAPDVLTIADRDPSLLSIAADLAASTPGSANVRIFAGMVVRDAIIRRVRAAGGQIAKLNGPQALTEAQRLIADCAPNQLSGIRHVIDCMRESVSRMQAKVESTTELTGIPTSWPKLDALTAGWQPGDLIILAARPSVGKTGTALQAALHACNLGHRVLFVSMEMAGAQLTDRALASLAGVEAHLIRQPKRMPEEDWSKVHDAATRLGRLPLRIDDSSSQTIETLCARIRQAHFSENLSLVIVDYAGLIAKPKAETNVIAMGVITHRLKALAKDLRIPVVLLAQMNRGVGRPSFERLRESGDMEQDADVVIFLHRQDDNVRDRLLMILAKQRNGPVGDIALHADLAHQRFLEAEWEPMAEPTNKLARFSRPYVDND